MKGWQDDLSDENGRIGLRVDRLSRQHAKARRDAEVGCVPRRNTGPRQDLEWSGRMLEKVKPGSSTVSRRLLIIVSLQDHIGPAELDRLMGAGTWVTSASELHSNVGAPILVWT